MSSRVGPRRGQEGSQGYGDKGPILTELSNKEDVLAKMKEAEERAIKELKESGRSTDLKDAKERVKRSMKPKEEQVSGEILKDPSDPEVLKTRKATQEVYQHFDKIQQDMVKERPSLRGRITQGRVQGG